MHQLSIHTAFHFLCRHHSIWDTCTSCRINVLLIHFTLQEAQMTPNVRSSFIPGGGIPRHLPYWYNLGSPSPLGLYSSALHAQWTVQGKTKTTYILKILLVMVFYRDPLFGLIVIWLERAFIKNVIDVRQIVHTNSWWWRAIAGKRTKLL